MMRVVLTAESYLPYLSGVTVSVDSLARGLGDLGHEVMVLAPGPATGSAPMPVGSPGPEPHYAWLPSYQLPRIVPPGYRMPLPLPWTDAVARARRFAPDVVHAHSPFVTGLLARRLARAVSAPLVFTHHTRFADYDHYLGPVAGPGATLIDAYLGRYWRGCRGVIAPSEDMAVEIRARLADRRGIVHVIPTGVDVAGIRSLRPAGVREWFRWPADAVLVASLGRLAPEKSPMVVLDAVANAAAREPSIRVLVVGGGPSEEELRGRARASDLAGRVGFTGALPRLEALSAIAAADLFVFASRTETQGLVLAEALSAGLPAVAVDGPGVRDSVRDGIDGIVIAAEPAGDRAARLGAALAGLAGDPARRAGLSTRARADADRFSVAARVAETAALYRTLLAREAV